MNEVHEVVPYYKSKEALTQSHELQYPQLHYVQ